MNNGMAGFMGTNFEERMRQILYPNLPIQYNDNFGWIENFIENRTDDNPFIVDVCMVNVSDEDLVSDEPVTWDSDHAGAQEFLQRSEDISAAITKCLVIFGAKRFALATGVDNAIDEISKILPPEINFSSDFAVAQPKLEKALLISLAREVSEILNCKEALEISEFGGGSNSSVDTLTRFLSKYAATVGATKKQGE